MSNIPATVQAVIPIRFTGNAKPLSEHHSLCQRYLTARGNGVSRENALFLATHDRAATTIAELLRVIEATADQAALAHANGLVNDWNRDAEDFLKSDGYGR